VITAPVAGDKYTFVFKTRPFSTALLSRVALKCEELRLVREIFADTIIARQPCVYQRLVHAEVRSGTNGIGNVHVREEPTEFVELLGSENEIHWLPRAQSLGKFFGLLGEGFSVFDFRSVNAEEPYASLIRQCDCIAVVHSRAIGLLIQNR
jgi:hypothetical protein